MTANGGSYESTGNIGGGGRLALVCTAATPANDATYRFDACYGRNKDTERFTHADFGTLYLNDAAWARESFVSGRVGNAMIVMDDWTGFDGSPICLTNRQVRLAGGGLTAVRFPSVTLDAATLEFGGDDGIYSSCNQKFRYQRDARGVNVTVDGDVTLTNNAVLTFYGGITNGNVGSINYDIAKTNLKSTADLETVLSGEIRIGGWLTIHDRAAVYAASHPYDGGSVRFDIRRLAIREGGTFSAASRGWATGYKGAGYGPGAGTGYNKAGSYGGLDGYFRSGTVYGLARYPTLPGSGSGCQNSGAAAGNGGGLVWIETRRLQLDGTITADGETASGTCAPGGSGGGVYLVARKMACGESAAITAKGGNGHNVDGMGGGGGRIAVYTLAGTLPPTLTLSAAGGYRTSHPGVGAGEDGTVFVGACPPPLRVILK